MANECGAKTRAGGGCRKPAMLNGRCRLHGGLSTGPKVPNSASNAIKHGFYSDALQPEERQLWDRVEIGTLDDEIRLMKVKLHRLVRLSGSSDVADIIDAAFAVAVKHDTHPKLGEFDKREIKVKAATYADLICQCIDQIRKLELGRKELNKDPEDPDDEGPVQRIILEVVGANASHDDDAAAG